MVSYTMNVGKFTGTDALSFWVNPLLAPLAEDLKAVPASEAYGLA